MKEIILKTMNLEKRFADSFPVKDVSITIQKGEIYGFIGQNGAGKTTTLRLLTSLIFPSNGKIMLFGDNIKNCGIVTKSRIGAVIENPAFYPNLSAYDNLEFYRIQKGIVDKNVIDKVLELVNLTNTKNKKYKNFSLGMKQRLGIALAILNSPDFLILDEPLNGLDPMGIVEFREIIKKLNEEYDMTILLSSHILSELSQVATKFGFIHNGKLIREISKKQLEQNCNKSLSIIVDKPEKAIFLLENNLKTTNFILLPNNEIRLYDYLDNPSEISFQFNNNDIRISSIKEIGLNLEDYFIELISNIKLGDL